ncbi:MULTISPECIES: signal peptide peptidase SppA [unclassified Moraxella]|uniref:signal peptide peptidase SppA n=1 Tax=unclassified Moraxella TaxID=2685852 RepID=UPI003AF554FE
MSDNWPPDPNRDNSQTQPQPNSQSPNPPYMGEQYVGQPYSGQEWRLLEKTLMASIVEQRRARRWSIFFKLLTFGYIILVGVLMAKGCSPTATKKGMADIDMASPHLAVIDVNGVISAKDEANSESINEALTEAFDNEQAKAVALRINSPGGSPVQSDEVWQTMTELRKAHPNKKLYAVIEDMGASGAYYIASGADEIWVNPSSLVGSIGVIMPSYNIEGLMNKYGVKDGTMTAGEHKDILSMSRDLTEFERTHVQGVLDNTHSHFINAVKQGRGNKLKDPEGNQLFSGLFWSGEQAINLGLADKKGSIASLEKQLKLDNAVVYNEEDPMKKVFGKFASQIGHGMGETFSKSFANQMTSGANANDKGMQ